MQHCLVEVLYTQLITYASNLSLAAQMWLLGRVIPFLVEDIPEEDEKWKNYVQLMEIVDLLMAPAISEYEVAELGVLISYTYTHNIIITCVCIHFNRSIMVLC